MKKYTFSDNSDNDGSSNSKQSYSPFNPNEVRMVLEEPLMGPKQHSKSFDEDLINESLKRA